MSAAGRILAEALVLPADERAALVDALIESLQPLNVSSEWSDEIRGRIEAIERGEAQPTPWPVVRSRLRSR